MPTVALQLQQRWICDLKLSSLKRALSAKIFRKIINRKPRFSLTAVCPTSKNVMGPNLAASLHPDGRTRERPKRRRTSHVCSMLQHQYPESTRLIFECLHGRQRNHLYLLFAGVGSNYALYRVSRSCPNDRLKLTRVILQTKPPH